EEVDRDVEVEPLERLLREPRVGQRDERIEADGEEPPDFAPMDHLDDLGRGRPLSREVGLGDAPRGGDVRAVSRVLNVASAGELVAALAVLPRARAVSLPRA